MAENETVIGCEPLDNDGSASIVYHKDGKATVTIRDRNRRTVYESEATAEDCKDLWLEFDYDGHHYKANVFDQNEGYGVGCWVYPNGDETEEEITLETYVYQGTNLIRTNNDN